MKKKLDAAVVVVDFRTLERLLHLYCRVKAAGRLTAVRHNREPNDECTYHPTLGDIAGDAAELQHTLASLPVEGIGETRTLSDVFQETLTEKSLTALDGLDEPGRLWSLPGFQELGRIRVAKSKRSKTAYTLADVFPFDMGYKNEVQYLSRFCVDVPEMLYPERPPSEPRHCVMRYGCQWWEFFFYSRTKSWTRIECNGDPTPGSFVAVFMASSCRPPRSWALAKLRNNISEVKITRNNWLGGTIAWAVCCNHRACLEPGNCVGIYNIEGGANYDYL